MFLSPLPVSYSFCLLPAPALEIWIFRQLRKARIEILESADGFQQQYERTKRYVCTRSIFKPVYGRDRQVRVVRNLLLGLHCPHPVHFKPFAEPSNQFCR